MPDNEAKDYPSKESLAAFAYLHNTITVNELRSLLEMSFGGSHVLAKLENGDVYQYQHKQRWMKEQPKETPEFRQAKEQKELKPEPPKETPPPSALPKDEDSF